MEMVRGIAASLCHTAGGAGHSDGTVDGCRPGPLGFYRMFERMLPLLRKVIYG